MITATIAETPDNFIDHEVDHIKETERLGVNKGAIMEITFIRGIVNELGILISTATSNSNPFADALIALAPHIPSTRDTDIVHSIMLHQQDLLNSEPDKLHEILTRYNNKFGTSHKTLDDIIKAINRLGVPLTEELLPEMNEDTPIFYKKKKVLLREIKPRDNGKYTIEYEDAEGVLHEDEFDDLSDVEIHDFYFRMKTYRASSQRV